jgi:hypothetical protein
MTNPMVDPTRIAAIRVIVLGQRTNTAVPP